MIIVNKFDSGQIAYHRLLSSKYAILKPFLCRKFTLLAYLFVV